MHTEATESKSTEEATVLHLEATSEVYSQSL